MTGLKERVHVIKNIKYEIMGLEEKLRESRAKALKITPEYKVINVQESNLGGSKIESHAIKESEILEEIKDKTNQIKQLRNDLEHDINKLEDKRMALLLVLRYVYNYNWDYIASMINYSESHTRRVYHDMCVEAFNMLMQNNQNNQNNHNVE